MISQLEVMLPFPVHGLPEKGYAAKVQSLWPVVASPNYEVRPLATEILAGLQQVNNPAFGWTSSGEGNALYSHDAFGLTAITRITLRLDGELHVPLYRRGDGLGLSWYIVTAINNWLDFHTAQHATFWTPRIAPRDIVSMKIQINGREMFHSAFSGDAPMGEALKYVHAGSPSPYAVIAQNWSRPWGSTVLGGLRDYYALRGERAVLAAGLAMELLLNEILAPSTPDLDEHAMRKKGEELVIPLLGASLGSRAVHRGRADDWRLIIASRNALAHGRGPLLKWRDTRSRERDLNMGSVAGSAEVLVGAARLMAYVWTRSQASTSAATSQ